MSEDDEEEEGEEDDEEAEGDEDEDEAPRDKKKKGTSAAGAEEAVAGLPTKGPLTLSLVQGWTAAALAGPSLGAMRHLAQAYRAACHYGDSDEAGEAGLQIASSALFNRIMLFMLVRARRAWEEGVGGLARSAMVCVWNPLLTLVESPNCPMHALGRGGSPTTTIGPLHHPSLVGPSPSCSCRKRLTGCSGGCWVWMPPPPCALPPSPSSPAGRRWSPSSSRTWATPCTS